MSNEQFTRTELLLGQDNVEALAKARVAVFGVGGVGGFVVEALARAGVGALDLIDNDTVCLSNINRQIIALHSTVGMQKTEAARQRILDINPDCKVTAYNCFYLPETADQFDFTQYDYVVDAIDTVTGKIGLVMQAQAAGTPIISCMGAGNKLDPTSFKIADIYKTDVCPLAKVMRRELKKRGVKHLKVLYSTEPAMTPKTEGMEALETEKVDQQVSKDLVASVGKMQESGQKQTVSKGKRTTPGSVSFVPSVAGLIIGGEVIKDLTVNRK